MLTFSGESFLYFLAEKVGGLKTRCLDTETGSEICLTAVNTKEDDTYSIVTLEDKLADIMKVIAPDVTYLIFRDLVRSIHTTEENYYPDPYSEREVADVVEAISVSRLMNILGKHHLIRYASQSEPVDGISYSYFKTVVTKLLEGNNWLTLNKDGKTLELSEHGVSGLINEKESLAKLIFQEIKKDFPDITQQSRGWLAETYFENLYNEAKRVVKKEKKGNNNSSIMVMPLTNLYVLFMEKSKLPYPTYGYDNIT